MIENNPNEQDNRDDIDAHAETRTIISGKTVRTRKKSRFSWLFHPASIWGGIILLGPFALPLLWKSDAYSKKVKILVSIAVMIITVGLMWQAILQGYELFKVWRSLNEG